MDNVSERLEKCFAAVFPELSPAEITRATPAAVASWDSVATITLFSVIEEEFGVAIDPEEAQDLPSFALILDHLRSKGVA